jgi:formylglycine-generating enzyme
MNVFGRLSRRGASAVAFIIGRAILAISIPAGAAVFDPAPKSGFKECGDCPEMIVIPAGHFMMGAAPGEEAREELSDEFRHRSEPQHAVAVKSFAAGKFEVTRGQYRAFAEATGRSGDGCFGWVATHFEMYAERNWRNTGYGQEDSHPTTCVSWEDANAYASWLSQRTGKKYRLLTEAEWEYAARGGTTTRRFWGDDANISCDYANGADISTRARVPGAGTWSIANCNDRYAYSAPVGTYRANPFGLHDTLGNVEEWTQDCWNVNYLGAPVDGRAATGGDCGLRVARGGSWHDAPVGLRSAYRVGSPITIRVYSRGFRVARDI